MNTPAHLIINMALLGRKQSLRPQIAILVGALLPDAAMFVFYFIEKVVLGTPEHIIWSERYYDPLWQNVFDVPNSIPLILVGLAIAWRMGSLPGKLLFASMLLHVAGDLPFHNDDGHRHFYPFSDWRFESPVSYWDRDHYGGIFAWVEAAAVFAGCLVLVWRGSPVATRILAGAVGSAYLAFGVYAATVWGGA